MAACLLVLPALLSACQPRGASREDAGTAEAVLEFARAGSRGDVDRQLQLLAAREDRNPYGARVLREMYPPRDLLYFDARSAELVGVSGDTAWWNVLGMGPDLSHFNGATWETVNGLPQPRTSGPTDAELLLFPRTRREHQFRLRRGPEGWKLPLASAQVGPVLMGLDTLDARCPYSGDPRPCRALAERLVRMLDSLPPGPRDRWDYLRPQAIHRVRAAQAVDSLRLELLDVQSNAYSLQTGVEVAVINRSSVALSGVSFRVLDAEGSVLVELWHVNDLPARGRKETYVTIDGRRFPRPLRLELVSAHLK